MCSRAIHTSLTPGTTNVYVGLSLTFDIHAKWTSRMVVSGLGWKSSKQNLLCALHIAHAAVVHRSISSFGSLSNMLRVKRKKNLLHRPCSPESYHWPVSTHYEPRGIPKARAWHTVSLCWWHTIHRCSICNFFLCKLSGQDIRTSPP